MSGIQHAIAICLALTISHGLDFNNDGVSEDILEEAQQMVFLTEVEEPDALMVNAASRQAPYEQYYYYQQLSDDEKRMYAALYEGAYLHFDTYWLGTYDQLDRIGDVFACVLADSPELFYVSPECNYYAVNGFVRVNYTYYYDAAETDAKISALNATLQEALAYIPVDGSAQDKLLAIHDIVCARATYDDEAAVEGISVDDERYIRASNAYNALVEGSAICGGYAKAVEYLGHLVGVPVIFETGYIIEQGIQEGGHAWNVVELEGSYFVVDTTFDDTLTGTSQPSHEYFLMPYESYQTEVMPLEEYGPLP